ncbi:PAS domain S-box protein [Pseudorhizobium pelagicum]|uniref:PAS domain S-box protein n=1 Tax=Pseudorhizobium pelagicum TaxID=1509405 RepID=UPI0011110B34|nr:PAS domain S-box protein [Pseudorhizobium pelagicum]
MKALEMLNGLGPTSPLGSPSSWSAGLRTLVATVLQAPLQVILFWGPDYIALYNDAYAATIGDKHPSAFGQPASFHWRELWHDLEPLLAQVRETGNPVLMKDRPFSIERQGLPENVTFDISFSPVPGEAGAVAGVLCIVNETTERTAYEQRIRESEIRFRNMADSAPVMMWVVDETGYCTYLNLRWYAFTGQTAEQAEGYGWLEAMHPDDKERASRVFLQALASKQPFRLEYRLRRADGVYRWAIDAAEPRFTPDGVFVGYIGSVIDIDDRFEIEQKLRQSEANLRAITHSIDQMIWATRPDGFHDFYNDRWYEYTGVPCGSTDGAGWNDMFHPDDQERAWAIWQESLSSGKPYHIEYRLKHRSGEYRWVIGRANAVRGLDGEILRWYGTCTDIHELKTAELHRSALVAFQEKVADHDDPVDVAYAASQMLGDALKVDRVGYGTIDIEAETVLIDRDWTAETVESLKGVRHLRHYGSFVDDLKRGETVVFEDAERDPRTRDKAANLAAISARSIVNIPIREQSGLVALLFINSAKPRHWTEEELRFIRDVAELTRQAVERRRAEAELRHLTQTLEEQVLQRTEELRRSEEQLRQSQKMEAVGQLTGGIAHDFNNNLAVIIGGLSLLQRRLKRGETHDLERLIVGATEGAQRAATLTQRLLAFSRQQPLSPEPVDGNRMVAGMNDLLVRSLGEHIRIETVLAAGLWKTRADVSQLENAILNLAVNARDAMPDGGRLTIETANAHVDDAYAGEHDIGAGQYVLIAVTDTGTGMTPDVIARAFDPFFTTKVVGKGTGLGLSQVFGFVRQTGGHIKIYSEPGQGTTVKIYLRRFYGEDAPPTIAVAEPQVPRGTGERIFVVEDDDRVRFFTVETLRELGYSVTYAASGPEALSVFEAGHRFDLLFTDIVMPEMNGRRLADKALELQPGLKVVFATGYTSNAVVHNGIVDPGTNFLQKPFTIDQVARKLRDVLDATA